jgi:flagellar FliL protein
MAEQQDDIAVVEDKGSKTTKILIIVIAVLVLAVAGLAVMMLMGGDDSTATEGTTAQAAEETVKLPPIFYTVDEPFIVNFSEQSNGAVRYMQIKMKLMARNQSVVDAVKVNMPAIKHELLLLYYSQKYDDLKTQQTQPLQQASLDIINQVLKDNTSLEDELEAVYFTSFIMQ